MKRRLKRFALGTLVVVLALAGAGWVLVKTQTTHHSPPSAPPAAVTPSDDALLDAIRRGIEFLKVHQEDDQLAGGKLQIDATQSFNLDLAHIVIPFVDRDIEAPLTPFRLLAIQVYLINVTTGFVPDRER